MKNLILMPFGGGDIFTHRPKILPALELGAGSTGAFRVRARAAVRVRGFRAQRRGRLNDSTHFNRTPAYWPAFALRGRPLSAALSSPASAARVRWRRSTDCGCWSAPTHTRPQTRKRQGAWSVDTGRSQCGVQSDVRRGGGERPQDQQRRAARVRRGQAQRKC